MPLDKSGTKSAFSKNVSELMHSGRPQKQALAIAYDVKRRGKANGGLVAGFAQGGPPKPLDILPTPQRPSRVGDIEGQSEAERTRELMSKGVWRGTPRITPEPVKGLYAAGGPPKMSINQPYYARAEARGLGHTGPILSAVGGRTDHHAMSVPAKSYVLPADHVSSLGQGNSLNGLAVLNKMFPIKHGAGPPRPPQIGRIRASGGATEGDGPVPIYAAGGEFVISPEHVAELGGGDHAHGHRILDSWVKSNRKKHIKTLSNLPGPAKD